MYSEISYKTIKSGIKNKKRRTRKPWWNDKLTELWNVVCVTERNWLKCTAKSDKSKFKSTYVPSRKSFDREVQRSKRLYWFNFQRDLISKCNSDNASFWKTIGKVGVGHTQKRLIPMEVVLDDGCISHETVVVLDKWRRDFSSLLNCQSNRNIRSAGQSFPRPADQPDPQLEANISIFEVKKAVDNAKKGKVCGIDAIPVDVLCNATSVSFLHVILMYALKRALCHPSGVSVSLILFLSPVQLTQGTQCRHSSIRHV